MKVILIDCKYVGGAMCYGRKSAGLNRRVAANMLRISLKEYKKYEQGTIPVPENVLQSIMHNGFLMKRAKCGI